MLINQFLLLMNVQRQHHFFWLQLWNSFSDSNWTLRNSVLRSISLYMHDNLLYRNSVCTLWLRLLTIFLLLRNPYLRCLFFSLLARWEVYDICICFWMFEHSNVWLWLHPFFYKQSIFDPRPENRLSSSKKPLKSCLAIV